MLPKDVRNLFHHLHYTKSASEIVEAATKKAKALGKKIEERQQRLVALRQEYGIDDAALIELLTAARKQDRAAMTFTYTSSAPAGGQMKERTIGAGVVNNLLTESDFIEAEKDQVQRLWLIARNLKPVRRFSSTGTELPPEEYTLSTDDLEYLGF